MLFKRTFQWLLAIMLFGMMSSSASALSLFGGSGEAVTNEKSIYQTITNLQNTQQERDEKKIELRLLEENSFVTEQTEIDQKIIEKIGLEREIASLLKQKSIAPDLIVTKQDQLKTIEQVIVEWEGALKNKRAAAVVDIRDLKDGIIDDTAEIEKLKALLGNQALEMLIRMSVIVGFILILLIVRFAINKAINRATSLPQKRAHALKRLTRIVFNVLVFLTIFFTIFSQFVSILPFLAILGTAVAWALRDVLSSFIAWFVIGSKSGYKMGDLIEVGEDRGRVIEITPLLTIIRQTGMRGDTGRILSIPNNSIFHQHIVNFSKMYRFTYIMLNYYLTYESDIDIAKQVMKEAITEQNADIEDARRNAQGLQNQFGLSAESIEPKVYIEPDTRGILLRGKFICRLDNRFIMRSNVSESFVRKIQKTPRVELRTLEVGEIDKGID